MFNSNFFFLQLFYRGGKGWVNQCSDCMAEVKNQHADQRVSHCIRWSAIITGWIVSITFSFRDFTLMLQDRSVTGRQGSWLRHSSKTCVENVSLNYLFNSQDNRQDIPSVLLLVVNLMFPQSNCPPTELVLLVFLVQQFGIASQRNISKTRCYLLMFLACNISKLCLVCLLLILLWHCRATGTLQLLHSASLLVLSFLMWSLRLSLTVEMSFISFLLIAAVKLCMYVHAGGWHGNRESGNTAVTTVITAGMGETSR